MQKTILQIISVLVVRVLVVRVLVVCVLVVLRIVRNEASGFCVLVEAITNPQVGGGETSMGAKVAISSPLPSLSFQMVPSPSVHGRAAEKQYFDFLLIPV